ncbi:MAG: hypothetical protein MUF42_02270 [Cytophagaceae bacterium]|jgi:4-hydroxybenzoate polyprenyltransferase|nr:hypothetical protein [Cytophagaceae bacterium]
MNSEKQFPFWKRFYLYQKERFPFLGHGLLISVFSFSAISYSRICRGMDTFIDGQSFAVCIFNTVGIFFLLRIYDEFKDQHDDALYRQYLPVPRGLITLRELSLVGTLVFALLLLVNLLHDVRIFPVFFLVMFYLFLMGQEFFIASWLKKHQFWYVTSHMMIIPLVDMLASGFDWKLAEAKPPIGLLYFFGVSFFNGLVLEIGRKIKAPEKEEPGVLSYTHQLGTERAVYVWIALLWTTAFFAFVALYASRPARLEYAVLLFLALACTLPAIQFLRKPASPASKWIEYASILWTFAMYLSLGGLPMFIQLFQS